MWFPSMIAHVVLTFHPPSRENRRQEPISPVPSSNAKRAKSSKTPSPSFPVRKSPRLQKRPLEIQNEISSSLSSSSKKRKAALEASQRKKKQSQKRKKDLEEEQDLANQSIANVEEKKQKVATDDKDDQSEDETIPRTAPPSQDESKARTPLKLAQLSELTSPTPTPKSPKTVENRPLIDNLDDWNADKARLKKRADKLLSAFD